MDVSAVTKYVHLSPRKARDLASQVRGKTVSEALRVTEFSSRKAAEHLGKTLKSAVANAENNAKLSLDDLWVKEAVVDEGPRMRRFWSRARGSASRILKRMCHIKIVLTDGKSEAADAGQ